MPKTRSLGQPETFFATWHIASSGFETTIRIASGSCGDDRLGDRSDDLLVRRDQVVPAHVAGSRGTPAVKTTTSEPAVSS